MINHGSRQEMETNLWKNSRFRIYAYWRVPILMGTLTKFVQLDSLEVEERHK